MMRKIFLLFLLSFLILSPGLAAPAEEGLQEAAVEGPVSPPPPRKITAIEVKGNESISTNTILSKMKTRSGNSYQENVINDDLKRLYLLGFFSDVKIDTQDYKDGVKIIVTVKERPIIDKINFSGVARLTIKDEKLREELKSREGQYLDYPSLGEDVRIIKGLYEKKGYSDAQIKYQMDFNKETGKAAVTFIVTEGKRVRIKDVFIEGNKAFPDRRILKVMKTKRAWLFNSGLLKEDVLGEDIERVRAFYRRAGYTDVEVDYQISPDSVRPYLLSIAIKLKEGQKYLVGNITVEGNKDIPKSEILGRLKECVPGKVFSQEALRSDVLNIQGLYFDRGYISCLIQETTSLNSYTGHVDIIYNIIENEVAYVDKIKIRGNVKTKDMVIRRELRIRPGDKFDGEKLRRSKERLTNLGFFEEVSYDTEDTPVPDRKGLVVDVRESKTGTFSFGGGYSTVEQFVGFVEIEQNNFDWKNFPYFTGGGQNLKFRASLGTITNAFDLSFTEPWVFDYPVAFGFDVYKREHARDTDVGYGYDQVVTGGDLRLGKELSEYTRANAMYRYDRIKISNVSADASGDLKKEEGNNTISSMQFGASFDSRDNIFDTRKGNVLSGSIECAGGPFGGSKDFAKFSGRASHYFPLFRQSNLEVRLRAGLADAYADSDEVPLYERFFAGGADTVRGYHERKVGPVDPASKDPLGGESVLIGNLEYTYPLFSFLKLAAFYDVGSVWAKVSEFGSGGFKSGIGVGVRIKSPIGPIRLDFGIPLNIESGEDKRGDGILHFSASRGF
ncbi:MAG: outer membrane protein assembly factor BamA [Candidatus Omnitrophota bacterium]